LFSDSNPPAPKYGIEFSVMLEKVGAVVNSAIAKAAALGHAVRTMVGLVPPLSVATLAYQKRNGLAADPKSTFPDVVVTAGIIVMGVSVAARTLLASIAMLTPEGDPVVR